MMKFNDDIYKGNAICKSHILFIEECKHCDIYSFVASKIFDIPYEDFDRRHEIDDTEQFKKLETYRNIAKNICLNRKGIEELSDVYCIPDLADKVVKAFPYTDINIYGNADEDSITFEDKVIGAYTFISWIVGYFRLKRFMSDLDMITYFFDSYKNT